MGKESKEDLRYLFAKHVIPVVRSHPPREVTPTSLQLLLGEMAEGGCRKSTVEKVRTHTRACFEHVMDEDVIEKNPMRKLVMPNIRKKSCESF
jgi:site-specific recombinase XerD